MNKTKDERDTDLRAEREARDKLERDDKKRKIQEQKKKEKEDEERRKKDAEVRYTCLFTAFNAVKGAGLRTTQVFWIV